MQLCCLLCLVILADRWASWRWCTHCRTCTYNPLFRRSCVALATRCSICIRTLWETASHSALSTKPQQRSSARGTSTASMASSTARRANITLRAFSAKLYIFMNASEQMAWRQLAFISCLLAGASVLPILCTALCHECSLVQDGIKLNMHFRACP